MTQKQRNDAVLDPIGVGLVAIGATLSAEGEEKMGFSHYRIYTMGGTRIGVQVMFGAEKDMTCVWFYRMVGGRNQGGWSFYTRQITPKEVSTIVEFAKTGDPPATK